MGWKPFKPKQASRMVCVLLLLVVAFASNPVTVHAQPAMDNFIVPMDQWVFNPCALNGAGERIHLTGNLHIILFSNTGPAGNEIVKSQANPQGLSGIGEMTHLRYRGTGMSQVISTVKDMNNTYTTIDNMNFIAPGKAGNFTMHTITHVTVNANGQTTAQVAVAGTTCK